MTSPSLTTVSLLLRGLTDCNIDLRCPQAAPRNPHRHLTPRCRPSPSRTTLSANEAPVAREPCTMPLRRERPRSRRTKIPDDHQSSDTAPPMHHVRRGASPPDALSCRDNPVPCGQVFGMWASATPTCRSLQELARGNAVAVVAIFAQSSADDHRPAEK